MKTTIILTVEDKLQLREVLGLKVSGPKPSQDQQAVLKKIISKAKEPSSDEEMQSSVGFSDQVSLVSPEDSSDNFNFRIVLPANADPDQDLISILFPISLAVIGRGIGENVSWESPVGKRTMRIDGISKVEKMLA